MNDDRAHVSRLLRELEMALRAAAYWDVLPPDAAALDSVEPFCVDTLSFPQWLQWVFAPRVRALLDAGAPLPTRCGVAPMAEMFFLGRGDAEILRLIELLREIDRSFEGAAR